MDTIKKTYNLDLSLSVHPKIPLPLCVPCNVVIPSVVSAVSVNPYCADSCMVVCDGRSAFSVVSASLKRWAKMSDPDFVIYFQSFSLDFLKGTHALYLYQ